MMQRLAQFFAAYVRKIKHRYDSIHDELWF
jgi:hypothetical protein